MSDTYLRTGRGGAGNFYSQKDVEDAAKGERKVCFSLSFLFMFMMYRLLLPLSIPYFITIYTPPCSERAGGLAV